MSETINVLETGAVGDGSVDDRPAIQAQIDACEARGGGTIYFPARDFLLNSWVQADHPWQFFNLSVGSNVILMGAPGARLLQGPKGIHPAGSDWTFVRNTVLQIGPHASWIRWQDPECNGGWRPAEPVKVNSNVVTLKNPLDAIDFTAGDWIGVYESDPPPGDSAVYRSEFQQILAVDDDTGAITVRDRFARSFPTAYACNITPLVTQGVTIQGLTIEGTEPLAVMEAIDCSIRRCELVSNTAISEQKNTFGLNINSVRNYMCEEVQIYSVAGGAPIVYEIAQRNSGYFTYQDCTFQAKAIGLGEYANHCKFATNECHLYPDESVDVAVVIGGADVVVAGNSLNCGEFSRSSGAVLSDFVGPNSYAAFVTHGRFLGNSIVYSAAKSGAGMSAIHIKGSESSVENNMIEDVGQESTCGVKAEGPGVMAIRISGNRIDLPAPKSIGLSVLPGLNVDCAVIAANTIKANGKGDRGILIGSGNSDPAAGGHSITGNVVMGFKQPLTCNYDLHPGTSVIGNPDIPDHM